MASDQPRAERYATPLPDSDDDDDSIPAQTVWAAPAAETEPEPGPSDELEMLGSVTGGGWPRPVAQRFYVPRRRAMSGPMMALTIFLILGILGGGAWLYVRRAQQAANPQVIEIGDQSTSAPAPKPADDHGTFNDRRLYGKTTQPSLAARDEASKMEVSSPSLSATTGDASAPADATGSPDRFAAEPSAGGTTRHIDPGELDNMVRTTYQLASSTVGIDNAMAMQARFAQKAADMGISPAVAAMANQDALSTYAVWQRGGYSAHWNSPTPEEAAQMAGNLNVSAAGSEAAARMGLVLKFADRPGGFTQNTAAWAYAEALKSAAATGATTWVDPQTGKTRSLDLGLVQTRKLMATAGIDAGEFESHLVARDLQKYIVGSDIGTVVRPSQLREVSQWAGMQLETALGVELQRRLLGKTDPRTGKKIDANTAAKIAYAAIRNQGAGLTEFALNMKPDDFMDDTKFNANISGRLKAVLGDTQAGQILGAELNYGNLAYDLDWESYMNNWHGRMGAYAVLSPAVQHQAWQYRLEASRAAGLDRR